jgi:galactokinase
LVKSFRDCTENQLEKLRDELGEILFKRCHFVVNEIRRVNEAVAALDKNDFEKLGQLMYETHDGLSKEYEVSCEEIDFLVASVRHEKSVLGARMMGGGFGGCSLNLVEKGTEEALITKISEAYLKEFGLTLSTYKVKISKGTTNV